LRRLSYANVVATLALFIALGGGAYAATKLPKNSVGPTQLRRNAVTSGKVKDGSLHRQDFATKDLATLRGPTGPTGVTGATGPKGDKGAVGSLSADSSIASGQTIRGVFGMGKVVALNEEVVRGVALPVPAPTALDTSHVNVAGGIDDPTSSICTGSYADPTAPSGYACLYPAIMVNATALQASVPSGLPTRFGFTFAYFGAAAGFSNVSGSWAYTAP
jgi:hypothetical protein